MPTTIEASVPCLAPPAWAVLERRLLEIMDQAVYPFLDKYTRQDGTLIWADRIVAEVTQQRDGADDFYESFYNWPLLYLLGGGDHLLPLSLRQWEATTRQLTQLGLVYKEYERGYDQFHQGESYIYFYFLCLANPANPEMIRQARRFAGFYLNEDPEAPNYDTLLEIIRAPHNGSGGPRPGFADEPPPYAYEWRAGMAPYGLPFHDIPGIDRYEDLKDPELARRMGAAMQSRMGQGDVVANLTVTSLVANAFLLTGEQKYRQWILRYVDAWSERARQNGGLLPDNTGLSGQVGEYLDGKWYGGLYGWTWPHGFYNIEMAALVAATSAYLVSKDPRYLELPRTQLDTLLQLAEIRDVRTLQMSLEHHWIGQLSTLNASHETLVMPYRYSDHGWFDYQPVSPIFPTAIWNLSTAPADWQRIEEIRQRSGYDWRLVLPFRTKEESGHEQPWLRFLAGNNPGYPEAILSATYGMVCRRLEQIRLDDADLTKVSIHHWQNLNPVSTEALVQLTLGAPQIIYNGGLLVTRVRYFDPQRQRPGLPPDVAALIEKLQPESTTLHLVNLNPFQSRDVLIQAGAFAEHRITTVHYAARTSGYPGSIGSYAAPGVETMHRTVSVMDKYLQVHLPPASEITLELEMERFVNTPTYDLPW
ncbi:MAG: hypothetical protein EXR62_12595 [Chloroflexi bacterium]|nr:hypothetical protein [Chloroflexota bacterium]